MRSKLVGLILAFGLLLPLGAAAQTVTIEGGGAGFGVAASTPFGTVSDGVGGGYAGASVALPGATWLQPFFAANGFSILGGVAQAGANFRLGPERWLARPVLRAGAAFGSGSGAATGGGGVYIGRRGGGQFTVDWGSIDGVSFAIVHFGAYYSF